MPLHVVWEDMGIEGVYGFGKKDVRVDQWLEKAGDGGFVSLVYRWRKLDNLDCSVWVLVGG